MSPGKVDCIGSMEQVVARMIKTPSVDRMQRFYAALAASGIGAGLEVKDVGEGKGKGLFANKTSEEGDVVLIEPPLVASQDTANKADALVCAHCFQYVGSIELQIGRRLTNNQAQNSDSSSAEDQFAEGHELGPKSDGNSHGLENRVSETEEEAGGSESGEEGGNGLTEGESRLTAFDERNGGGGHCCEDDDSEDERIPADPATVAALLEGSLKLPLSAEFPLPGVVECLGGCSENVYCSDTCRDLSWEAHHKILCSGPRSEAADVEALRAFKEFADVSNNIFHVAAQVIATTVLRTRSGGGPTVPKHLVGVSEPPAIRTDERDSAGRSETTAVQTEEELRTGLDAGSDAPSVFGRAESRLIRNGLQREETGNVELPKQASEPCSGGDSDGQSDAVSNRNPDGDLGANLDALLRAWEPFSMGWKGVWWESVACPPEMTGNPEEEAAFRTSIRELCEGSLELLRTAFGREAETLRPLFSLEVYSRIIGMFELNNLALVVPTPVENYFLAIDDLPENEKREVESVTKPLLDALGRSYATHCEGTAFYTLQSCANHSCEPNARAFKREQDVNGHAVLLAKRRIERGEEVTISYIDETDIYVERQSALADYGFVCCCEKCKRESRATELARTQ